MPAGTPVWGRLVRQVVPRRLAADNQCFTYDHQQRLTEAWTATDGDCSIAAPLDHARRPGALLAVLDAQCGRQPQGAVRPHGVRHHHRDVRLPGFGARAGRSSRSDPDSRK
jgi:hypothetical protein